MTFGKSLLLGAVVYTSISIVHVYVVYFDTVFNACNLFAYFYTFFSNISPTVSDIYLEKDLTSKGLIYDIFLMY